MAKFKNDRDRLIEKIIIGDSEFSIFFPLAKPGRNGFVLSTARTSTLLVILVFISNIIISVLANIAIVIVVTAAGRIVAATHGGGVGGATATATATIVIVGSCRR